MNFEDKITDKWLINSDQLEKSLIRAKQYIDGQLVELDINGYKYVDMGEAGIWAKYPIGVTEWNYNSLNQIRYFQWGDTEGYTKGQISTNKKKFEWSDYKYCQGTADTLTKYCVDSQYGDNGFTDNLTILNPEDDAAHVNMGGDWRMPTADEFQKLIDLCDTEVVSNYNGAPGLNGRIFKLKSNQAKQIFIPYAGYYGGGKFYNVGEYSQFASSSLYTKNTMTAKCCSSLFASSSTVTCNNPNRYVGECVLGFLGYEDPGKYLTKKEASETYVTKDDLNGLGGNTEGSGKKTYTLNIDTTNWDGDFDTINKVTNPQSELDELYEAFISGENVDVELLANIDENKLSFRYSALTIEDDSVTIVFSVEGTLTIYVSLMKGSYSMYGIGSPYAKQILVLRRYGEGWGGTLVQPDDEGTVKMIEGEGINMSMVVSNTPPEQDTFQISADTNVLATKEHVNTEAEKLQEAIDGKSNVVVCDNQYEFDKILTKDNNTVYLIKGDQDQWFSKEDGDELYDFYGELLERVKELERLNGINNYNNDDE